jgi:hypothetical protein
LGFALGFGKGRQKHGSENGDDGDDHQQFNQGKSRRLAEAKSIPADRTAAECGGHAHFIVLVLGLIYHSPLGIDNTKRSNSFANFARDQSSIYKSAHPSTMCPRQSYDPKLVQVERRWRMVPGLPLAHFFRGSGSGGSSRRCR